MIHDRIEKTIVLALLLVAFVGGGLALFLGVTGCEPQAPQDPSDTTPSLAVLGGGIEARVLLETPQGQVELDLGAEAPLIDGAEGWRVLEYEATGHLEVRVGGGEHAVELHAEGDGEGRPCVRGSYTLGGLVLAGEVPGTECEEIALE